MKFPVHRSVAVAFGTVWACSACTRSTGPIVTQGVEDSGVNARHVDALSSDVSCTVYGWTDLPRTSPTQELSSTYYDLRTRTLYAIQDKTPSITLLVGSENFKTWTLMPSIALVDRPTTAWDGEGLTFVDGKFYAVTMETAPLVETFDLKGAFKGTVAIPSIYTKHRVSNRGLESLTVSPDNRYLFTVNEEALAVDGEGPTKQRGTTVRILRRELATDKDLEVAYRTEPLGPGTGGNMGVAELAALSGDRLLVLERGYQADYGNTVRVFEVSLSGATDVKDLSSLTDDTHVLKKTLIVDLLSLPSAGFTSPGLQKSPLLENYECLSIGPMLPDGRRLLFLTSDDNARSSQVPRILTLAVTGL